MILCGYRINYTFVVGVATALPIKGKKLRKQIITTIAVIKPTYPLAITVIKVICEEKRSLQWIKMDAWGMICHGIAFCTLIDHAVHTLVHKIVDQKLG